jgi:predicted dehydrogenase
MRIGFLDHHLDTTHPLAFLKILRTRTGNDAVEVVGAWESHPAAEDWCKANGVPRMNTAEEVVAASDAIMVLAPNDPEAHLALARPALLAGKPIFIDKDLAASFDDGKEILSLARQHGAAVMAASSLRFAVELDELEKKIEGPIDSVNIEGIGHLHGYGVHSIAIAMRMFGSGVKRVASFGNDDFRQVILDDGKRIASIVTRYSANQYSTVAWRAGVLTGGNYYEAQVSDFQSFYTSMLDAAVQFFKTRKPMISDEEMLMIIRIEQAAEESLHSDGGWIKTDVSTLAQ